MLKNRGILLIRHRIPNYKEAYRQAKFGIISELYGVEANLNLHIITKLFKNAGTLS